MRSFEQFPFIDGLGHDNRCRPIAHIRSAIVGVGAAAAWHAQGNDAIAVAEGDRLNIGKSRWLDAAQLIMDLLQCPGRDNLSDHLPRCRHAEQDKAANAVEHGAGGSRALAPLAGRFLELNPVGLPAPDEFVQLLDVHTSSRRPKAANRFAKYSLTGAWAAARPFEHHGLNSSQ